MRRASFVNRTEPIVGGSARIPDAIARANTGAAAPRRVRSSCDAGAVRLTARRITGLTAGAPYRPVRWHRSFSRSGLRPSVASEFRVAARQGMVIQDGRLGLGRERDARAWAHPS